MWMTSLVCQVLFVQTLFTWWLNSPCSYKSLANVGKIPVHTLDFLHNKISPLNLNYKFNMKHELNTYIYVIPKKHELFFRNPPWKYHDMIWNTSFIYFPHEKISETVFRSSRRPEAPVWRRKPGAPARRTLRSVPASAAAAGCGRSLPCRPSSRPALCLGHGNMA